MSLYHLELDEADIFGFLHVNEDETKIQAMVRKVQMYKIKLVTRSTCQINAICSCQKY